MRIPGSRVGVVGGSVAGCLAALALHRAGCEVAVLERSSQALADRGSGIGLPQELRERLIGERWVDAELRSLRGTTRLWLVPAADDPAGRVIWRQRMHTSTNSWGVLWRALRAMVPDEVYRHSTSVHRIDLAGPRPVLHTDRGVEEFDVVVGADGYRSTTRAALHPGTRPGYAGYVLWRGNYDSALLPADAGEVLTEGVAVTACYAGGHLVAYFVPGPRPGLRTVNWAMYTGSPSGASFEDPTSLPPGALGPELLAQFEALLAEHLPPAWAGMVRATPADRLSLQPIYDHMVRSYTGTHTLLIGDAATLARPHTGSGVDKAAADAFALADLAAGCADWPELLTRYDAVRRPVGDAVVELGRRLGRDQVQQTPDWASLGEADLRAWATATLAGQPNHMYRDLGPAPG